jgi:hypothetical protein
MLASGLTKADIRHCETMAALPEAALPIIRDAAMQASKRPNDRLPGALLKALELAEHGSR